MDNDRTTVYVARLAFLVVVAMLIAAACGGGPPLPSQVEITEKEWAIEHNVKTVQAGKVTFTIKNEGALEHNFVVEGVDPTIEVIPAQQTDTLEVTLEQGTYKILCDLPGHQEAGMVSEITVK